MKPTTHAISTRLTAPEREALRALAAAANISAAAWIAQVLRAALAASVKP